MINASNPSLTLNAGVHLCASVIPNMFITMRSSAVLLDHYTIQSSDTAKSRFLGVMFLLSYTNSMYHLMLISAYRLAVILWPLWIRSIGNKCIIGLICCAWLFALSTALSSGQYYVFH